jgi:hypothetical protein
VQVLPIDDRLSHMDGQIFLSTRGLANIPFLPPDFTFIVGDTRYDCSRYLADFLSPKLSRFHRDDPLLATYTVRTHDHGGYFRSFLSLVAGQPLVLSGGILPFISELSLELENSELCSLIAASLDTDLSIEDISHRVAARRTLGQLPNAEIEFLASHFASVTPTILDEFAIEFLAEILSNQHLRLRSEDHLCEYILGRIEKDPESLSLLEFVQFDYLTIELMQVCFQQLGMRLEYITEPIWRQLGRRLLQRVNPAINKDRFLSISVPYAGDMTKGILAALAAKYGGNPHVQGIVQATASGIYDGHEDHAPMQALEPSTPKFFWSNKAPDSWICIDFMKNCLEVTHYALQVTGASRQTHTWSGTSWNPVSWNGTPRSWVIEGSIDGTLWEAIDQQVGRQSPTSVYEVKGRVKAKMIRMRNTEKNGGGTNDFILDAIEFFGILTEA